MEPGSETDSRNELSSEESGGESRRSSKACDEDEVESEIDGQDRDHIDSEIESQACDSTNVTPADKVETNLGLNQCYPW